MSKRRVPIAILAAAACLLAVSLVLLRTSPRAKLAAARETRLAAAQQGVAAAAPSARVPVDAIRVVLSDARVVVDISGSLEAHRTVLVGAEVGGRVVEVAPVEHRQVAAGDVLVRLDDALARASVERARAATMRAGSARSLASQEYGRQRDLSGQGVASQAAFDRTESEAASSEALLAEANAALLEAQTLLDKTNITAPFAGVVGQLELEPGAYLRTGDPVATLSDLSQIEIEVGVDDRQILALAVGAPARVSVDAYPGEWFEGRIHALGRTPDPVTRKYPVPVRVPNPDERLLPGMLGRVRFELGDGGPTLRIPRRALHREFEVDYVYLLHPAPGARPGEGVPGRVERRRVRVLPIAFRPDLLELVAGLEAGSLIAVSGIRELHDELEVQIRERPAEWSRP